MTAASMPQPHGEFRGDGRRHADVRVRLDDGPLVTGGQFGGGEVVDVVDRADAPAADRVGADAVLGVDHVVCRRGGFEGFAEDGDGAQDPFADRLAVRAVGERHDPQSYRGIHRPEETGVAPAAQRPHRDVLTQRGQRLGEGEGVDDAAAWLGGVAEQGDLHGRSSR